MPQYGQKEILGLLYYVKNYHFGECTHFQKIPIEETGGLNVIKFNDSGLPFHPTVKRTDDNSLSLFGVPVLVLDCEPDIISDPDAREEYSRTLHAFWKYAAQQRRAGRDVDSDQVEHSMFA